jgi:hypothetical protein
MGLISSAESTLEGDVGMWRATSSMVANPLSSNLHDGKNVGATLKVPYEGVAFLTMANN